MSVADSGPYKSRFFNFISSGTQKLTDQSSRTWRYLRFATEIALQAALYPVYFILQTVRVNTQKLGTTLKQRFPQLNAEVQSQPPDVDTPILNIVTTETESLFKNSITSQPAAAEIQDLASQIDSHTLVLVQKDDQILESLSVEQHQLQHPIDLGDQNLVSHPKPFNDSPNFIAPIRGFWQVMGWVQTSPLAVKINYFGESDLVQSVAFPQPSPKFIHSLDFAIAQVEDYSIIPLSQATHSLLQHSQTLGKTVIQTWQHPHLSVKSASSLETGFDHYFYQVQSLIFAAIDYFFQDHQQTIHAEDIPEQFSGEISTLTPASLADPGLTIDARTNNILSKFKKPKTPNHPIENNRIFQNLQASFNRFSTKTTPEDIGLISATVPKPLTKTPNRVKDSDQIPPNPSSPTYEPDWLEAQVTSTGYIKHPLEKILGWLDQIMVKVEEAIAKTWYWFTHYE